MTFYRSMCRLQNSAWFGVNGRVEYLVEHQLVVQILEVVRDRVTLPVRLRVHARVHQEGDQ